MGGINYEVNLDYSPKVKKNTKYNLPNISNEERTNFINRKINPIIKEKITHLYNYYIEGINYFYPESIIEISLPNNRTIFLDTSYEIFSKQFFEEIWFALHFHDTKNINLSINTCKNTERNTKNNDHRDTIRNMTKEITPLFEEIKEVILDEILFPYTTTREKKKTKNKIFQLFHRRTI